ncbi:MAG: hypothetical protein IKV98_03595 [Clostridia bacterium]|nr:hypothetical protein [Clostridia bacterium]
MFNITLAGVLGNDAKLRKTVDEIVGQVKAYIFKKDDVGTIKFFVSDEYSDVSWKEKTDLSDNHLCVVSKKNSCVWQGDSRISVETSVRYVICEMLCHRSDLVIAVWDETVTEMDGATWEMIQRARSTGVPLVWISSVSGNIYWCENAFYEPYTPEKLKRICELYTENDIEEQDGKEKRIPLLFIGKFLYESFMKRHSPKEKCDECTDFVMQDDFSGTEDERINEKQRKKLIEAFKIFDNRAVQFSRKYKAVIYWRAILPIICTFFIAFGYYAESLLGFIPAPENFWPIVGACGFLIYGGLNVYVYILSKSDTLNRWRKVSADSRFVAEVLRVMIHFEPYGIKLNLKKLCGGNNRIYKTVKKVADSDESYEIDRKTVKQLLLHLDEMLGNQICYHKTSADKYESIVKKLQVLEKAFLVVGFLVVLFRAFLRGISIFFTLSGDPVGGISLNEFVVTIANMLALVVPAVASYYTAKLGQCNFKFNYDNHNNMEKTASDLSRRVKNIIDRDSSMTMEMIGNLGEDIASAMLIDDASGWHRKYISSTIKRL